MSIINIMSIINVIECSQRVVGFFLMEANTKRRGTIGSCKSVNLDYIPAVSLSFVTQPTLGQTINPSVILMAKECIHI